MFRKMQRKQQNSFSLFDLLDQQADNAQQNDVIPEIFQMVVSLNYSIELCADWIWRSAKRRLF